MANVTPHIKLSFLFHYDEKRRVTAVAVSDNFKFKLKPKEISMEINGQKWHPFVVDLSTQTKEKVCMFFLKKIGEFYNHFNTNLKTEQLTLLSMKIGDEPIFVYHSMQFKRESNEVDITLYFLNKQLKPSDSDKKYRSHKRMELCYLKLLLRTEEQRRSSVQDTANDTKATDKEIKSVQHLCDFLDNDIKKAKKINKYDYDNYLNIQVATDEQIPEDEWDKARKKIVFLSEKAAARRIQRMARGVQERSGVSKTDKTEFDRLLNIPNPTTQDTKNMKTLSEALLSVTYHDLDPPSGYFSKAQYKCKLENNDILLIKCNDEWIRAVNTKSFDTLDDIKIDFQTGINGDDFEITFIKDERKILLSNKTKNVIQIAMIDGNNFKNKWFAIEPLGYWGGHPNTHHHPQTRRRQPTTTHPRHTRRKHRTTHPTN